eukprot:Hpha_TRINITY_DN15786_c1_g1::TRINITY_DN15786_c1_g1_i1::g.37392::m.37392
MLQISGRRCLDGKQQRRSFHYWFTGYAGWKQKHHRWHSVPKEHQATYPNAQELPNNTFSYMQRARNIRMLQERYQASGQSALLQFNIMVRQKILPTAYTYTALIGVMARARMEPVAYTLFDRMLQQGIQPLPETYQALMEATDPRRMNLLQDIRRSQYACMRQQPYQLRRARKSLLAKQRTAAAKYLAVLTSEDPEQAAAANIDQELRKIAQQTDQRPSFGVPKDSIEGTLYVDSLRAAFLGEEWAKRMPGVLMPHQRDALLGRLQALTDLELQMFLAVHRRLREGDRDALLQRVVNEVPEGFVFEMLEQRDTYVAAIREVLSKNQELARQVESAIEEVEKEESPTPTVEVSRLTPGGGMVTRRIQQSPPLPEPSGS